MRLFWYRKVLMEHSGGCAGITEYYRSTGEAVLVRRVLYDNWEGCLEYYMSCQEAVVV